MFETETMAELCLKQGLVRDALLIYRRLLASAPDRETRERRAQRIAELEQRDAPAPGDGPAAPAPARAASPTSDLEAICRPERRPPRCRSWSCGATPRASPRSTAPYDWRSPRAV